MSLLPVVMLSACTQPATVVYSSSCAENDVVCQRNLNARTLSEIGQEDAAIQLMCMDDSLLPILGDKCAGR